MPKIIKANEMNINGIDNINLNINSKKLEDDTEKQQLNSGNVDTILNISKTAKLMSENNSTKKTKKAGETASREAFEDNNDEAKIENRYGKDSGDKLWLMYKIERPDYYALGLSYRAKAYEYEDNSEEYNYWKMKESALNMLYIREVTENGGKHGKYNKTVGALRDLEKKYSDEIHDTSFNIYTLAKNDTRSNIWGVDTKFNVVFSTNIMETLLDTKCKKSKDLYALIDDCVGDMKRIEMEYEGDKEMLRFGVRIEDDGKPTYYANYKGCENPEGVSAKDADELLKKIMD